MRFGGLLLSSKAVLVLSKKLMMNSLEITSFGLQEKSKKQIL
jgi:hypothetical protein